MINWQPIETFPRVENDQRHFVVWCPNYGKPFPASYYKACGDYEPRIWVMTDEPSSQEEGNDIFNAERFPLDYWLRKIKDAKRAQEYFEWNTGCATHWAEITPPEE